MQRLGQALVLLATQAVILWMAVRSVMCVSWAVLALLANPLVQPVKLAELHLSCQVKRALLVK